MIKKVLPKTALISVSNKSGILTFARLLQKNGVKIFATGGTASALRDAGIKVSKVSSLSRFPEIFGGRVKTLSPYISGGILGQRDKDKAEAKENNITWIDLVVCNLYPFSDVAKNTNSTMDEKIENIDIGGPTMIRAAAKNFKWVSVVVSPKDYRSVGAAISGGGLTEKKRFSLAKKAFGHCAEYDQTIFEALSKKAPEHDSLRYGENPHQQAFVVKGDVPYSLGIPQSKQHQGKALSYNNYLDGDAALQCLSEFKKSPACVIVKHNSPCGVGLGKNVSEAFTRALNVDSLSAFGGVVAINKKCTVDLAKKIDKIFFEIIVAPSFDVGSLKIFSKKKNLRVLSLKKYLSPEFSIKTIGGGSLGQERDDSCLLEKHLITPTKKKLTPNQLSTGLFAWKVVKHTKSNAIVVAKNNKIISISGGQTSRVDATKIAFEKTKIPKGCIVASDAFFPFKDSIEKMAQYNIAAIIQPGGSIRDKEVVESCNKNKIAMAFTGFRVFKH